MHRGLGVTLKGYTVWTQEENSSLVQRRPVGRSPPTSAPRSRLRTYLASSLGEGTLARTHQRGLVCLVGLEEALGWHSAETRVDPLWTRALEAMLGPGKLLAHHEAEGRRCGLVNTHPLLVYAMRRAEVSEAHRVRSTVTNTGIVWELMPWLGSHFSERLEAPAAESAV